MEKFPYLWRLFLSYLWVWLIISENELLQLIVGTPIMTQKYRFLIMSFYQLPRVKKTSS